MRIRLYNDNPEHQKILKKMEEEEKEKREYAAELRASRELRKKERNDAEAIKEIMLQNQQILIAIGATLEQLIKSTNRAGF